MTNSNTQIARLAKGKEFIYKLDKKMLYVYTGKKNPRGVLYFDTYYMNFRGRMFCTTTGIHQDLINDTLISF